MRHAIRAALAAIILLIAVAPSLADDWVAVKLRGAVVQLIANEWVELKRGDVVPDDRVVRTLKSGKVQFKRGRETIDLGPQTQIQIVDKPGRLFTTVKQHFGTVSIEADVRNVEHFAVHTPHLAAVVKGTKFVVTSGKSKATVKVTRGAVAVEDGHNGQSVVVVAGQTASTEIGEDMAVAGRGKLPTVVDEGGQPVAAAEKGSTKDGSGQSSGNGGNGNGNGGVGNTVSSAASSVGNAVSSAGGAAGDAVGGPVGSAVGQAAETVGNTVGAAGGAVGGLVGGLL